jgi:hypothetical protein
MQVNKILKNIKITETTPYPLYIFVIFRFLLGIFLLYYYITEIPYIDEIYSNQGLIPSADLNSTFGYFPSILYVFDSPFFVKIIFIIGAVISCLFAFGICPRIGSFLLWYIQTSLYNRNNLVGEPAMAFVGLLLVMFVLVPKTKQLIQVILGNKRDSMRDTVFVPVYLFYMPIFIFCLTFTLSAIDKLYAESWVNGQALNLILSLNIGRDTFLVSFLKNSEYFVVILSYLALFAQLICLPLFIVGLLVANIANHCQIAVA